MWAIYSPEDFPKWDEDNAHWTDYRQSLGVQVVLKAGQWTPLGGTDGEGLGYKQTRWESWVDAAGEGRESFVTCKDVALRMAGDFKQRGIVAANIDLLSLSQVSLSLEDVFLELTTKDAAGISEVAPAKPEIFTPIRASMAPRPPEEPAAETPEPKESN